MTRLPYTRPAFHCIAFGAPTARAFLEQMAMISTQFRSHRGGRFLGIIDRNPSVSKSNRLYVVIIQFFIYEFDVGQFDVNLSLLALTLLKNL